MMLNKVSTERAIAGKITVDRFAQFRNSTGAIKSR